MDSLRIPGGIPEAWERTFAFCAPQLVDPNSDLSTQYPDLHQTFSTRMADALAARNNEPISRCGHLHPETHTRFDSREAQETSRLIVWEVYKREDDLDCRRYKICADLRERAQIYGFIGAGSKSPSPFSFVQVKLLTTLSSICHGLPRPREAH